MIERFRMAVGMLRGGEFSDCAPMPIEIEPGTEGGEPALRFKMPFDDARPPQAW